MLKLIRWVEKAKRYIVSLTFSLLLTRYWKEVRGNARKLQLRHSRAFCDPISIHCNEKYATQMELSRVLIFCGINFSSPDKQLRIIVGTHFILTDLYVLSS